MPFRARKRMSANVNSLKRIARTAETGHSFALFSVAINLGIPEQIWS